MTSPSATTEAVPSPEGHVARRRPLRFSVYYFTGRATGSPSGDPYRFIVETARFADRHGFHAVWLPERHFHEFGGLFPNPSVVAAALASLTERVALRAGSVVLPLHHPARVAEEWAVVDNLSGGRAGISIATGWHPLDFVLQPRPPGPGGFDVTTAIDSVRRLWAGEAVSFVDPDGVSRLVRTFPRPVNPRLPLWITSGGSEATFVRAGSLGANLLTALLNVSATELAELLPRYHEALAQHGHRPEDAEVTVMLHTFLGRDEQAVRARVEGPLQDYLRSHLEQYRDAGSQESDLGPEDAERQVRFAFERYYRRSSLMGTPERCAALVAQLAEAGVTEIACLIDFGVGLDDALESLRLVGELQAACAATGASGHRR